MARRSYLSRIAEPLTAADPVIWSTPRASADEARPVTQPVRTAPLSPKLPADPAAPSRAASADAPLAAHPEHAAAALEPVAEEPPPALRPLVINSEPARGTPEPPEARSDAVPAATRHAPSAPEIAPRPSRPSTTVDHGRWDFAMPEPIQRPAAIAEPLVEASREVEPAPSAEPFGPTLRPTETQHVGEISPPDRAPLSRMSRPGVAPRRASEPAPRLHIGAIEIRVTAPAPPPAAVAPPPAPVILRAAPAASGPLARAYASRFGLAQS